MTTPGGFPSHPSSPRPTAISARTVGGVGFNPATGRKLLAVAFFIAIIMVTYSEIKGTPTYNKSGTQTGTKQYILPRPQRYWQSAILFMMLGVMAMSDTLSLVAGLVGLGIDITVWMDLYSSTASIANPTQGGPNPQPPGTSNA